jgi:hypothetical protein
MIEQGRKGRFQGVMFYALGHAVDSFVTGENAPKNPSVGTTRPENPAGGPSCALQALRAFIAPDGPPATNRQDGNLQNAWCTNSSRSLLF